MIINPAYSTNPAPASPRIRDATVRPHTPILRLALVITVPALPPAADTAGPRTVRERLLTPSGPRDPTSPRVKGHPLHPSRAVPSQWAIASLREELCSFAKMRLM
ncbi:hypothetical protein GCM10022206_72270 [Streptomyces chiangmaiensis]